MASHYLSGHSIFDKTLQLLDSGAARTGLSSSHEQTQPKSILTSNLLTHVVAAWTQIPLTHLQQNKFQATRLVESLKKQIFGQDAAIELTSLLLQNASLKLQEKTGPLAAFLFAGATDTGKTATAFALTEHLFGSKKPLFQVNLTKTAYHSLSDIQVLPKANEHHCISLLEAVHQIPYAIILLENVDQIPSAVFDLFKDILVNGYAFDEFGHKYDFRHTIIVMTTRAGQKPLINYLL